MKSAVPFLGATYIVRGESLPLADVDISRSDMSPC